jgi:hypothetical protein
MLILETTGAEDFQAVKVLRNEDFTENDFILATSFTFQKTTKGLTDNNFLSFKTKIESAELF